MPVPKSIIHPVYRMLDLNKQTRDLASIDVEIDRLVHDLALEEIKIVESL